MGAPLLAPIAQRTSPLACHAIHPCVAPSGHRQVYKIVVIANEPIARRDIAACLSPIWGTAIISDMAYNPQRNGCIGSRSELARWFDES